MAEITKSRGSKYSRTWLRAIRAANEAPSGPQLTPDEYRDLTDLLRWRKGEIGWNPTGPGPGRFKTRAVGGKKKGSKREIAHPPGSLLGIDQRDLPGQAPRRKRPKSLAPRDRATFGDRDSSLNRVGEGHKSSDPMHDRQISPYRPEVLNDDGSVKFPERPAEYLPEGGGPTLSGHGETFGERRERATRARDVGVSIDSVFGGFKVKDKEQRDLIQRLNRIIVDADEKKFHIPVGNMGGAGRGGQFNQAGLAHLTPEERIDVIEDLLTYPPEDVLARNGKKFKISSIQRSAKDLGHKVVRDNRVSVVGGDPTRNHRAPTEDAALRRAASTPDQYAKRIAQMRSQWEDGKLTDTEFAAGIVAVRRMKRDGIDIEFKDVKDDFVERREALVERVMERRGKKTIERTDTAKELVARQKAADAKAKRAAAKRKKLGMEETPDPTAPKKKRKRRSSMAVDIGKVNPALMRRALAAAKKFKEELHPRTATGEFKTKPGSGRSNQPSQKQLNRAGLGTLNIKQKAAAFKEWGQLPASAPDRKRDRDRLAREKANDKPELREAAREAGVVGRHTGSGAYEGLDRQERDAARKKLKDQAETPQEADAVDEGKKAREAFDREASYAADLDERLRSGESVFDQDPKNLFDSIKSSEEMDNLNEIGGDHVSKTYTFKLKNGEKGFIKATAFDPDDDRPEDEFNFGDAHSEVAVASLAERMGVLTPRTQFASDPGEITGASVLQQHLDDLLPDGWEYDDRGGDQTLGNLMDVTGIDPDEIARAAVLDFITNQNDRHVGNFVTATDGDGNRHLMLMDNGGGFASMVSNYDIEKYQDLPSDEDLGKMSWEDYSTALVSDVNHTLFMNTMLSDALDGDSGQISEALQRAAETLGEQGIKSAFDEIRKQMPGDSSGMDLINAQEKIALARLRNLLKDPTPSAAAITKNRYKLPASERRTKTPTPKKARKVAPKKVPAKAAKKKPAKKAPAKKAPVKKPAKKAPAKSRVKKPAKKPAKRTVSKGRGMEFLIFNSTDENRQQPLGTVAIDEEGTITKVDNYDDDVLVRYFASVSEGKRLKRASASFRRLFFVPKG